MAVRCSMSLASRHTSSITKGTVTSLAHLSHACPRQLRTPFRTMATVVPPVTQDATSSKGPTAMVFMNMGGPATTDAVGSFLSRLFVKLSLLPRFSSCSNGFFGVGRCRPHPPWSSPVISRTSHCCATNFQNPKTVCSYRRRFSHSEMVGISIIGDVQDTGSNLPGDCTS